ncbi:cytochrome P450, partial [Acinetobacter baumannii]
EDGSLLSDQEIMDHMNFLMLAAHDTLTSSVSSLVYLLGANPEWQDRLRAEMLGLNLPSRAPLPYERLGELELLEMAFKEAMRINPPV